MAVLLWDFDNTLAYRTGLWSQCLADLVNTHLPDANVRREVFIPHLNSGFPWHTPDVQHHHLCEPDAWWDALHPTLVRALIHGADLHATDADHIAFQVRTAYTDSSAWMIFPEVLDCLRATSKRGWRHSILSNHVPELPQLVTSLGLADYFDHIITSAILGIEKPHVMAYHSAIDRISTSGPIIMVGDSVHADIQGAEKAGLDAILVRTIDPSCTHNLPTVHKLDEYVERWM